ncbi:hypothetical protein VKT23_010713 [Stygiomarasmius scandens]|uniref:Uncharacterized protein n=1 Tax=Marasmiellus scandens TaxID=2682957 RepID=A0ABR1JC07_9AGAR
MLNPKSWHHLTSTVGFDTRTFRKKRLDIFAGWRETPAILGALDFVFPQTGTYKGRVVEFKEETDDWLGNTLRIELYSRNSQQIPFFPGLQLYSTTIPSYPRVDGSQGPFDPTRNPLYFDTDHPYYPFIARFDNCQLNPDSIENVPPFLVWKSARFPEYESGSIQEEYIRRLQERIFQLQRKIPAISLSEGAHSWPGFLSSQPKRPSSISWENVMPFDDFLDKLSELQGWVKELEAWVRMGELLIKHHLEPSTFSKQSLLPADDSLMGVWINGMTEHQVAWLANEGRIPLFISHKIEGSKDHPEATTALGVDDPFALTMWKDNAIIQEWSRITRSQLDNIVSECSFNHASRKIQSPTESALKNWNSSSLATNQNFPGLNPGRNTIDEKVEGQDSYGPKPWLTRELSPLRTAWVIPPEVQTPAQTGKWEDFEEITDFKTNRQVLRRLGKKAKKGLDEDFCLYYDRQRKRRIHLEDKLRIPPGICHDIGIFGLPGPALLYFADHDLKFRVSASDWVYLQEKPELRESGRRATTPPLSSLPRINPDLFTESPPSKTMTVNPNPNEDTTMAEDSLAENEPPLNQSEEDTFPEDPVQRELQDEDQDVAMTVLENSLSTERLKRKRSPSLPMEENQEDTSDSSSEEEETSVAFPVEDLSAQQLPFLLEFSGRHVYYEVEAPTSILRIEKLDWTLDQFRSFFAKMVELANSRDVERLKITRIIRRTEDGKVEFWVKAWNRLHASWLIQLCESLRMYFTGVTWVEISLLRLDKWRDQNSAHESCCWEYPVPMNPVKEVEWRQENPSLLPRLNIPLEERLSEGRPTTASSSTSIIPRQESDRPKRTRRAGAKNRLIQEKYGPFPVNDPNVNFESWNWLDWLEEVWSNNKRGD